jgi:hypothetical protein
MFLATGMRTAKEWDRTEKESEESKKENVKNWRR